jgi:hypothetical protein
MLASLTSSVGVSASPVQITGTTSEGAPYSSAYGMFNDDGTTWTFDQVVTPVPGLGALGVTLLGLGQLALRRRRLVMQEPS